MSIQSSKARNKEHEAIPGIPWLSIGVAICGLFIAVLINTALENETRALTMLLVIGLPAIFFQIAQTMVKGDYDYQGFENLKVKLFSKVEDGIFDLNDDVSFDMEKERLISKEGYDITAVKVDEHHDAVYIRSQYRYLLKLLPRYYSISFFRDAAESGISKDLEAQINTCNLYVILEVPQGISEYDDYRKEARNVLNQMGQILTTEELASLLSNVINKGADSLKPEMTGFFASPMSLIREEAMLHLGDIEDRVLALSLAGLPDRVGDKFQQILNVIGRRPSTISTRFTSLGEPVAIFEWLDKRLLEKRTKTKIDDVAQGDRCNLLMTMTVLCHGTKTELEQLMQDLRRQMSYMNGDEIPQIARDNAELKKVLMSIFPGSPDVMPDRRKHKVKNLKEACYYIPLPLDQGVKNPLLQFRTSSNSLFNFSYDAKNPLYIWAGMGKGKTALMSAIQIAHFERSYRGLETLSFTITAGDGFHFLLDGIADLWMILEQDDHLNWKPLDYHPLEAFFAFGAPGIEKASTWIADICGITDGATILEIANILTNQKDKEFYRLSEFFMVFEEYVRKKWSDQTVAPDHSSRDYLTKLRNYCDLPNSQYGSIFDPKTTRKIDFNKIKNFYVTQAQAKKEKSEVVTSYFGLAALLFQAWELTTESIMLVTADELRHMIEIEALSTDQIEAFGSQGRKQGKFIVMGSQKLSDIAKFSSDFINMFQHFLFADSGEREHLERILRASSDERRDQKIAEFEQSFEEIKAIRNQGRGYSWGYIDINSNIHTLMADLNRKTQWLIGSDKPARDLKQDIQKKFRYSYFDTAKILALYGPGKVPREEGDYPTAEVMDLIYDKIIKHKGDL